MLPNHLLSGLVMQQGSWDHKVGSEGEQPNTVNKTLQPDHLTEREHAGQEAASTMHALLALADQMAASAHSIMAFCDVQLYLVPEFSALVTYRSHPVSEDLLPPGHLRRQPWQ